MKKTKQPFQWNKVTPLSKFLAMFLFIVFPFLGFYFGIQYQKITMPDETQGTVILHKFPLGWKKLAGTGLSEVGYDPKTMMTNSLTDMRSGLEITYGTTGKLYASRYNISNNQNLKGENSLQAILERGLNDNLLNKIIYKSVPEKTLTIKYIIDNHPAIFLYGVDENIGEIAGIISLDNNIHFFRIVSKGIPYFEFEKILATIKID